jgi:hypothetical protein
MSNQIPTAADECRGKISIEHVGRAVVKLGEMSLAQKEQLADEIVREQQALFTSFLVQKKFGVSYEKMEFLLNILFVCFLAMKVTALGLVHDYSVCQKVYRQYVFQRHEV